MNNIKQEGLQKYKIERIEVGGGSKYKEFNPLYESLSPDLQETIRWVAWRLRFSYYLRYDLRHNKLFDPHRVMKKGEDINWVFNAALPSLEIYLLFTCIDALAGSKHKYQQFPEWLDDINLGDEALTKNEIKNVFQEYKKEMGVGSGLRQLFGNLPPVTKDWLGKNCVFRKVPRFVYESSRGYDQEQHQKLEENPQLSSSDNRTISFLQEYFYGNWRNQFTHQAKSRAPYTQAFINPANDVSNIPPFPIIDNSEHIASYPPISYPPQKSENNKPQYVGRLRKKSGRKYHYWQLYISQGLDEATILRVIIQSHIYQALELDPNLINTYLYGLKFQSVLRYYAFSTESNKNLIDEFQHYTESNHDDQPYPYHLYGIPKLSIWWVEQFLEMIKHKQYALSSKFEEYVKIVKNMNNAIDKFNIATPPINPRMDNIVDNISQYREHAVYFLNALLNDLSPKSMDCLVGAEREMCAAWILPIAENPHFV